MDLIVTLLLEGLAALRRRMKEDRVISFIIISAAVLLVAAATWIWTVNDYHFFERTMQ